jgi:hypothetical protein
VSCYQLACGCWVTDVPGHGIGGYLGCIRCNTLRVLIIGMSGAAEFTAAGTEGLRGDRGSFRCRPGP